MAEQMNEKAADLDLGATLQQARRTKDLSIADVSKHLRLSKDVFVNLETEQWDYFPSRAYTRGYISNYAKFLELSVDSMLEKFDKVCAKTDQQENLSPYGPNKKPKHTPFWLWLLPITIILIAVVLGTLSLLSSKPSLTNTASANTSTEVTTHAFPAGNLQKKSEPLKQTDASNSASTVTPDDENVKASSSDNTSQSANDESASTSISDSKKEQDVKANNETSSNTQQAVSLEEDSQVKQPSQDDKTNQSTSDNNFLAVIQFNGDSWVGVTNRDGVMFINKEMHSGQTINIKNAQNYQIKLGKASQVKLSYQGKVIDLKPYTKNDIATLTLKD